MIHKKSVYKDAQFIITTLHKKAAIIAPIFFEKLGSRVVEHVADTDTLGTFSGETKRLHSFLDSARIKCELGLQQTNNTYALASEGCFGPHPYVPFFTINTEILYFIDNLRGFHLHIMHHSEKNNYAGSMIQSFSQLQDFAKKALFPSHAITIRPYTCSDKTIIFKGIQNEQMLQQAFDACLKNSIDGTVWIETDMRAHMNPSRQLVIQETAMKMAQRLSMLCPQCKTPGWGACRIEKKIQCTWCNQDTSLLKSEIFGCVKCTYEEEKDRLNTYDSDDTSQYCVNCNP